MFRGPDTIYLAGSPEAEEARRRAGLTTSAPSAPASKYPDGFTTTSIIHYTSALGSGPWYRIAPNGPQDVELNDSSIDSLLNMETDGSINTDLFYFDYRTGLDEQSAMPYLGDYAHNPRAFTPKVPLKAGTQVARSAVSQDTTPNAWDIIKFNFEVGALYNQDDQGKLSNHKIELKIKIYNRSGSNVLVDRVKTIINQNRGSISVNELVAIPPQHRSVEGYKFTVEKISPESSSQFVRDDIYLVGWTEIETTAFKYPGVALAGMMLLAAGKYQNSIPKLTVNVKGKLVRVPANYNQPVIDRTDSAGNVTYEIDWREVETNKDERAIQGIRLQDSTSVLTGDDARYPQIYKGPWNGKQFVYSWTQNPAWIFADIMTDKTLGLGIDDSMIDWWSFYAAAVYYDHCSIETGKFEAIIETQGNNSYHHKPRGKFTGVREVLSGTNNTTRVNQRRSTCNIVISNQVTAINLLNKLAASAKSRIVYSGGKYRLKVDRADEVPSMLFNDSTIKKGTLSIGGKAEKDVYTSVDVTYINPHNSFKREITSIDSEERASGITNLGYNNKLSLEATGITNKGEATRLAQYHIAASKYNRESTEFTTGPEAMDLIVGDIIGVTTTDNGLNYGFGGKVIDTEYVNSNYSIANLRYNAYPPVPSSLFENNSAPILLTVTSNVGDIKSYTLEQGSGIDSANNKIVALINENIYSVPPRPVIDTYGEWSNHKTTTTLSTTDKYTGLEGTFAQTFNSLVAPTDNPVLIDLNGNYYIVYNYQEGNRLYQVYVSGLQGSGLTRIRSTIATGNDRWNGVNFTTPDSSYFLTDFNATLDQLEFPKIINLASKVASGTDPTVYTPNAPTDIPDASVNDAVIFIIHRNYDNGVAQNSMSVIGVPLSTTDNFLVYERPFTTRTYFESDINTNDNWALGKDNKSYKEFRLTSIETKTDIPEITLTGEEYISNVYQDSESFIDITPISRVDYNRKLASPPVPSISVELNERSVEGDVKLDLVLENTTDTSDFNQNFTTDIYYTEAYQTRPINNVVQDR